MATQITSEQYGIAKQTVRNKHIKINVLNKDYTLDSSIEGTTVSGNISIEANSDIRRTCSISCVVMDDTYVPKAGGKIWFDKFIQIYVGIDNISTGDITWTNMGIYLINEPNYTYSSDTHTLFFQGVDLMANMTGLRNGILTSNYKIPRGSNVRGAIIALLLECGFNRYVVSECMNVDESIQDVPYDIVVEAGGTYYDLLAKLRDILPKYQIYFDVDGTFFYEQIPIDELDPIMIDDSVWAENVISEQVDINFSDVKNRIKVLGATHDANYYPSAIAYNNGLITLTISGFPSTIQTYTMVGFTPASAYSSQNGLRMRVGSYTAYPIVDESGNTVTDLPQSYCVVYFSNSKWVYIGGYQAEATLDDTNVDSPFYVGNISIHNWASSLTPSINGNTSTVVLYNTGITSTPAVGTQVGFKVINYDNIGQYTTNIFLGSTEIIPLSAAVLVTWKNNQSYYIEYTNDGWVFGGVTEPQSALGVVPIVLSGGDYDNIQTDALAMERAVFEIYHRCRLNDSITLSTVPVYWGDVNYKVRYNKNRYITQSINTDLTTGGSQSWTMSRFYPYYESSIAIGTPLYFAANTVGSTVRLSQIGNPSWSGEYSTDGIEWQTYDAVVSPTITLDNIGDKVYFRGDVFGDFNTSNYINFVTTGNINAGGNVNSMYTSERFDKLKELSHAYCFYSLFSGCTALRTVPNLYATSLSTGCYQNMFSGCSNITAQPELPATTLASYCYAYMFQFCTGLTTLVELQSTELQDYCYSGMFKGCTGIVSVGIVLPATTMKSHCYSYMFSGCTSLTSPPTLSSTTLSDYCYDSMFSGCTSITTAPTLSATILANGCYRSMFYGCTSLTSTTALPSTTLADYCYANMFEDCIAITSAPTLSSATLADYCYSEMFSGCTALATMPSLPATTLAPHCCESMFYGCTALTNTKPLSARVLKEHCYANMFESCTSITRAYNIYPTSGTVTLADYCCSYMFANCTNLTTIPSIPTTTLATGCYSGIFAECTHLTTPPALPATTLADDCYREMFIGCIALTSAPALQATTLANNCYEYMFSHCYALTRAPSLPATTLTDSCYSYMFAHCTSLVTAPALPATNFASEYSKYSAYGNMFDGCSSLIVSDDSSSSATNVWRIPSSGTFSESGRMYNTFNGCAGTRASWNIPFSAGSYVTYYTQNTQV